MVGIGPGTHTSRVARVQAITTDMTDADLGRCLPILQRSGMLGNERARVGNRRDSWPGVGFDGTPPARVVFRQHISRKIYKPVVIVIVRSFFDLKDQCHHMLRCRIGETAEP